MNGRGDPRPERERYQHASLVEQLRGELSGMRAHPGVILVALVVLGGGVLLAVLRPQVAGVRDLDAGDCLYIRAADAVTDAGPGVRQIGTGSGAVRALYVQGAERTLCELSHSHEVLSTMTFPEGAFEAYPGGPVLEVRLRDGCAAAFGAYVGRPLEGSALEMVVAVPDAADWERPIRTGVCLLANRDGTFLSGRAQGSGR